MKPVAAALIAVAVAILALSTSASAADQVQTGRTIEAFIGTDLVDVQGYPANRDITLEVLRNGVVVGSVSGKTDATGFAEFNHAGGGQVPTGDCFKPPNSPDVMPGDVIRTRTAGDRPGVFDSAVVRDLSLNFANIDTNVAAGTITVSGRVVSSAAAPIVPGTDVLELRLNKGSADVWDSNGRKDLREDVGANVQPNGAFTRTLNVGQADAQDWAATPGEVTLEWSNATLPPPAIFVADEPVTGGLPGCPPVAEYAVTSGAPTVLNQANIDSGVRLAGISRNATAVSVRLDDQDANTADAISLAATLQGARTPGFQTWRTAPMTAAQIQQLRALDQGLLTASATYTVGSATRVGINKNLLKDTIAPRAPRAAPRPGVYRRPQLISLEGQAGATIRFTRGPVTPTLTSPRFVRPIKVGTSQTIRAIAVDAAGNRSGVGVFRYVIRRR